MGIDAIAAIGYALTAVVFAAAGALFLGPWRRHGFSRNVAAAAAATAGWGLVLAIVSSRSGDAGRLAASAAEWLRYAGWIALLAVVLGSLHSRSRFLAYGLRYGLPAGGVMLVLLWLFGRYETGSLSMGLLTASGIVLALTTLGLIEQVLRALPRDSASGFKYVSIALVVLCLYDLVLFLGAIGTGGAAADVVAARGYVQALAVVPVLLFGKRTAVDGVTDLPRQASFSVSWLVTAVAIVIGWLAASAWVQAVGGPWTNVAGIVFTVVAIGSVAAMLVSVTVRSRVRVFLTKILFRYKYDYRKEWLRFIGTLSEAGLERVPTTSVRAVAQIVNSPGGFVWTRDPEGDKYLPVGAWRADLPIGVTFGTGSSLVTFLRKTQWVIDLNEVQDYPSRYDGLELDDWFKGRDDLWLVVPMLVGRRLSGFIVLLRPRVAPKLNFEDHDLLRTVGRHAGTHIKQAELDRRLAESSQFGAYHRLSAFLMHDLNNLIAQQSLVVKNAERFRHEPRFIDDTIDTIANSVTRMRRLMEQLTSVTKTPQSAKVPLGEILEAAVRNSRSREPVPTLECRSNGLNVNADPDRLTVVIEHLVRNAQEATPRDGRIEIVADARDTTATVVIRDTGSGMTAEFISERLFRPFDSTKGSQSMGIGAYQAREYVRMLGGDLDVQSVVGEGTTFSLHLPVAD